MLLDVSQPITNLEGVTFLVGEDQLKLKNVLVNVLLNFEGALTGSEKIERNKIAEKIWAAETEVELNLTELGKVKNLLEDKNSYGVRIVAESHKMLEGAK